MRRDGREDPGPQPRAQPAKWTDRAGQEFASEMRWLDADGGIKRGFEIFFAPQADEPFLDFAALEQDHRGNRVDLQFDGE